MLRRLRVLALTVAGAVFGVTAASASCPEGADPGHWIYAGGACLAVFVAGTERAGPSPKLVVLVHGDVSNGGPADYLYPVAKSLARPGLVAVAMLRPGYSDAKGDSSQGSNHGRRDDYTATNVTIVGKAIEAMKERYSARYIVVMGHSGGAAITGVLIGRQPGLIDAAVLVSCPCNVPLWRVERGGGPWPNSLSPHELASAVPKSTLVVAVTGTKDGTTPPALADAYVRELTARGMEARVQTVDGATHGFKSLTPTVVDIIVHLLQ